MWLVVKAGFDGDLRQRKFSNLHEIEGLLDALAQDELMRRQTDGRAKLACEMKRTHVRLFRQGDQRKILVQV